MTDAAHLSCNQCGKVAVSQGLCVDCLYKVALAQTLMMRNAVIMANHAAAELDMIAPYGPPTPQMQLPELPKGPAIMHNIHVSDSVVGSINTGTIQTVDVNIEYLKTGGNKELAEALQRLTESIANESALASDDKNILLDQVAYLSEQASGPANVRKRGLIKAAMDSLSTFANGANSVTTITIAWQHVEPILKGVFGY